MQQGVEGTADQQKGTWYLAGAMQGILDFNRAMFQKAAADLRARGYTIVSPAEINAGAWHEPDDETRMAKQSQYLRRDIHSLLSCSGIILLPGWSQSAGSTLELRIAAELGMDVRHYDPETGDAT